ncbi:MAG TPA: peptidoglycan DD-metalloendopeptidase family protein [Bacteroidales bacterium]|nr:peptidoglycan DD-metalloendopeptidase family protein [Bacteroidales bacterium]HOE03655.1 peptidoglycan DD-metalloendopeptidase family protein [Bacteroidales bacterium]
MKKHLLIAIFLIVLAVSAVVLYVRFFPLGGTQAPPEKKEAVCLYGIPVGTFQIITDTVRTGETIGSILSKYGISGTLIHKIGQMSCDSLNLTMIHVGNKYTVFVDTLSDSIPQTKYLVYENGLVVYTSFDFTYPDSVIAKKYQKQVDTLHLSATGVIETSLWNTLVGQDLSWELAIKLSQTFAWTIDFYGLQKGDYFKVLYKELSVEGESIGNIEVEAAVFTHGGKELWAIPFEQDSIQQYFDTSGMSMRKTFLKAPLQYSNVSSRYTNARMHPIFHKVTEHRAVDYSAPYGTPVFAASDGRIAVRGYESGAGNYIKIVHNSVYSTVYMHFNSFGNFQAGDYVKQGDIIGYVGSTGWSTGPHLHYEIHENGAKIDPLTFQAPPAEPVKPENLERFNFEKRKWIHALSRIKDPK